MPDIRHLFLKKFCSKSSRGKGSKSTESKYASLVLIAPISIFDFGSRITNRFILIVRGEYMRKEKLDKGGPVIYIL